MTPFWHPLSAVLVPEPPCFASPLIVRRPLDAEGRVELRYAGDRMWPALAHGQTIVAEALGPAPAPGTVVVASPGGIPEVLRVDRDRGAGGWELVGDADPSEPVRAERDEVLGIVRLPERRDSLRRRAARRIGLDLREAFLGGRDAGGRDAAETVRSKYDAQAGHYAASAGEGLDETLLRRLRRSLPARGRILVAGSGTGRECFALVREGWTVRGVDFSDAMVVAAKAEGERRGVDVDFVRGDLRDHEEPAASLIAVVFTYDVYSFVPGRAERARLLGRIARWLRPGGLVFLSARRVGRPYERLILSLQRLRGGPWGATHMRYIAPDGRLRRSFLQCFTERRLRREVERAGFRPGTWQGGHLDLVPRGAADSRSVAG